MCPLFAKRVAALSFVLFLWVSTAVAQPPHPFPTLPQLFTGNITISNDDDGLWMVFNATIYSLDANHTRMDQWFMGTFHSQIQLIDNDQLVEYLYYKDHHGPACTSHIFPAPHPMNISQQCPDPIYEGVQTVNGRQCEVWHMDCQEEGHQMSAHLWFDYTNKAVCRISQAVPEFQINTTIDFLTWSPKCDSSVMKPPSDWRCPPPTAAPDVPMAMWRARRYISAVSRALHLPPQVSLPLRFHAVPSFLKRTPRTRHPPRPRRPSRD